MSKVSSFIKIKKDVLTALKSDCDGAKNACAYLREKLKTAEQALELEKERRAADRRYYDELAQRQHMDAMDIKVILAGVVCKENPFIKHNQPKDKGIEGLGFIHG